TSDSPDSGVTQAIKLGSATNIIQANTISIGAGASGRSSGTLDFNTGTGTLKIRNLAGTGAAALNLVGGAASAGATFTGTMNLAGHSSDLLFSTLAIANRLAGSTGGATGTFTFDTGVLDASLVIVGHRSGSGLTTGSITGNLNLMAAGGTG